MCVPLGACGPCINSPQKKEQIFPPFGPLIPLIPFHFILFQTIPLFKFYKPFHSIPFFFNLFFQLSKSLYNIFKSQPFIPPRNSQSQTIQHIFFFKPFQTIFKPFFPSQRMEWDGQNGLSKHMIRIQGNKFYHH